MAKKSSYYYSSPFIEFFTVSILLLTMSGLFSVRCKSINKQSEGSKPIIMYEQDTTIEIRRKYTIKVPSSFKINSGAGDDTKFLQLFSENGEIFLGYEYGIEEVATDKIDTKSLRNKYEKVDKIKKLRESVVVMAYSPTTAKLRNIKGEIIIEHDGILTAILNFSCSSDKLDYLTAIIMTIKSID